MENQLLLQLQELLGYRAMPPPAHPTALPLIPCSQESTLLPQKLELNIPHGLALDCETLPPGASITFLAFSWKIGFAIFQFCRGRNEKTLVEAVTWRIWIRCKVLSPREWLDSAPVFSAPAVSQALGGTERWAGSLPAPRECVKSCLEKCVVKNEGQRGYMYTDGWFTVVVQHKLTQHCKAIILQLKKKKLGAEVVLWWPRTSLEYIRALQSKAATSWNPARMAGNFFSLGF